MRSHSESDVSPGLLDAEIDLRALVRTLSRRRWVAVAALSSSLIVGALVTLRAPRIYKARAKVMIDRSAPEVLGDVREVVDLGTSAYWNAQEYYETQYNVIRSRPVAEMVVARLGISPEGLAEEVRAAGPTAMSAVAAGDPVQGLPQPVTDKLHLLALDAFASRDDLLNALDEVDAADRIRGMVLVEPVKDSRLVDIAVQDTDPERAATIANAVADAYIEYNLDQKVATTRSAVDWLSDQTNELKDKLEKSEMALYNFKKVNNIVSVSMEDRQNMISQTLAQLNQSLSQTQAKRLAMESRRDRIRRARAQGVEVPVEAVIANELVQRLKANQADLEQEEAEAELKYTSDHPKLIAVRKKLRLVRSDIKSEIDKILETLDAQHDEAFDTERRLRATIDSIKAEALELNKKEIDYGRLKRDRDNNQALYDLVIKRQKEADLTQLLKVNNVRRLEAAITPEVPIRPRVKLNMLLALVMGVLGGIGIAFLVDYLDNTVKSQEQAEQLLGLPFLGILPVIKGEKGAALIDPPDRDHYIVAHPRSTVAECSRTVRTNLLFMSPDQPAKHLLITSSGPREGKSTTVVNLAVTMAQSGARTVVVDTDMRRPRLHKSFGVPDNNGVSNIILGDAALSDVLLPGGVDGLSLIPCGPIPPNPAELLHTERFRQLVKDLGQRFDRVLFDSPPVGAVTDPLVLGSMVDGIVLVIQAGKTSWQAAKQAARRLGDVGGRIFGVVLNDVDLDDKHYGGYYQYYYYRSGYGDEPKKKAG